MRLWNKGYTLIEMVAVILIMGLLTLLVAPTIINQITGQKDEVSQATLSLIYAANEQYLNGHSEMYEMQMDDTYCISLETLVGEGLLKHPIMDATTGKEIPLNKKVKTVVNTYREGEYTLVEADGC